MIRVAAHNILSPLGGTTEANLTAVRRGCSAIHRWENRWGVPQPFMASLFSDEQTAEWQQTGLTRFEALAVTSIRRAVADWLQEGGTEAELTGDRTVLILSSTKGNVGEMGKENVDEACLSLGHSAAVIAREVGITTQPITVDNACISGASAIIFASRLLRMGCFDHAVVCGCEVQSRFIISGFQSLKAMSAEPCRPFDIDRMGMNAGEAAATVILTRSEDNRLPWHVVEGVMRNDAHHVSEPSMTAEGAWRALRAVTDDVDPDRLAFISAHGTATMFNDQMEAVAIDRAGLGKVPVCAVKGNYGHTMGACGVLETILSMAAVDKGIVLPTKGFEEQGVSKPILVTRKEQPTTKLSFIKMLSGFGGGNAALLMSKDSRLQTKSSDMGSHSRRHTVIVSSDGVTVDGRPLEVQAKGKAMLTEIYKQRIGNYPRFYKMDMLSRLVFISAELLLKAEQASNSVADGQQQETDTRAMMFVGHSGSICADRNYWQTICRDDDYYPSPERFVYTLPNVVMGDLAAHNHYHGETSFFFLPRRDDEAVNRILQSTFLDPDTQSVIGGWVDAPDENHFEAEVSIIT